MMYQHFIVLFADIVYFNMNITNSYYAKKTLDILVSQASIFLSYTVTKPGV